MNNNTVFKSVVFAGGGSRCFWQLGFWNTVAPALNINPSVVSSVSAGAAFACFSLAADAEDILSYFKKATGINKKNITCPICSAESPCSLIIKCTGTRFFTD